MRDYDGLSWYSAALTVLGSSAIADLAAPWEPQQFQRRSPPYVPPAPSEDLINERLRLAAEKRARKAAKRKGGE